MRNEFPPPWSVQLRFLPWICQVVRTAVIQQQEFFSFMQPYAKIVSLALALIASVPLFAGDTANDKDWNEHKEFRLNEYGYETNRVGELIRVDRNRVFKEFVLREKVSTKKWPSGDSLEDDPNKSKDEGLFPFELARVRSLVIDGNSLSEKLGEKGSFKAVWLKGVRELVQVVFRGPIPRIDERSHYFGLKKDDDWRKGLKRVVIENDVGGLRKIPFLGDVKYLSLETGTVKSVCAKWSKSGAEDLKDLQGCHGLERLEIPYSMATNTTILWGELIRNSELKDREVVSFEGDTDGKVVLLNISESGEISDYVTTIRADAIPKGFRRPIHMPFRARSVIGGKLGDGLELVLKRGALLFYPEIFDKSMRTSLSNSQSFIKTCHVEVTTAYSGLVLTNSLGTATSGFQTDGSAKKATLDLLREAGCENRITAMMKLGDIAYPVQITYPNGKTEGYISLTFKHGVIGWMSIISILLGSFVFAFIACGIMCVVAIRRGVNRNRIVGSSIGFCIGVFVVVLGLENVGVLQYYTDTYLTGKAMSYLNSSFVSSLIISVSVTLVKLAVGLLQSVEMGVVFVNVEMQPVLQPVQDVLEKISTYSWISTCALAFMRMFCQVLKDGAAIVWGVLGTSLAVLSCFNCMSYVRGVRLARRIVAIALFFALGIPICLCGCAWFSAQLTHVVGESFDRAMTGFTMLAQSFSWESMKSMASVKEVLSQFSDAVSDLTSSAMFYVATKLFDCFVVPLLLYAGFKKAMKGSFDGHAEDVFQIRNNLMKQTSSASGGAHSVLSHDGQSTSGDQQNLKQDFGRVRPAWLFRGWSEKLRPEWVTAISSLAICVFVAGSLLFNSSSATATKGNDVARTMVAAGADSAARGFPWGQFVFSLLALSVFVALEYWCYRKAVGVCESTQQNGVVSRAQDKLAMLKERSYWFDLPLYFGLGGTVLGFLIISIPGLDWLSNAGRIVAYMSTLLGIGVTWWIQKRVISPYKTRLMEQMAKENAAHE